MHLFHSFSYFAVVAAVFIGADGYLEMRKASGRAIMFPERIATKMSTIAIDGMYLI